MAKAGKYSLKERLNIEELYNTFLAFSPREQLLAVGGIIVVLILIVILPISCASSRLSKLEKQIKSHEKNVRKVIDKIGEYKMAQERLKKLKGKIRPKSQVQLTTRLESLANKAGIKNRIDSLKEKSGTPGEDFEELIVAGRMSRLTLNQLVSYMHSIESQTDLSLKISRMQVKPRYDNRQQFNVNFEVSTLVSTGEGE